ncbi:MAG: helix-turn-helix transcriptional regulator [Planctomycetota bacterium]
MRSIAATLPGGYRIEEHAHGWAQLVYAISGAMTVRTADAAWVVPPRRAVWMPAATPHAIEAATALSLRTLYLAPSLCNTLPTGCRVLPVSGLLRELVLHVVEAGHLRGEHDADARLARVLADRIAVSDPSPLRLAMPADERARRVAERILASPGADASADELAAGSGASTRTIQRLFRREAGMTLSKWRQRARLLHAVTLLAEGRSVGQVADACGYRSASAFVSMFRLEMGRTPRSYREHADGGA